MAHKHEHQHEHEHGTSTSTSTSKSTHLRGHLNAPPLLGALDGVQPGLLRGAARGDGGVVATQRGDESGGAPERGLGGVLCVLLCGVLWCGCGVVVVWLRGAVVDSLAQGAHCDGALSEAVLQVSAGEACPGTGETERAESSQKARSCRQARESLVPLTFM